MDFRTFNVLMVILLIIYNVNLSTSKTINRNIDPETGHIRDCPNATLLTTPACGCTDPTPTTAPPTTPPCGCTDPTPSPPSPKPSPPCPPSTTTEQPAPPCTDPPSVKIEKPYPECPLVANPQEDVLKPLPKCCQFVHCDNFGVGHVKNCAPSDPPLVFSPCQNRCVWPWEAGNITCDPCRC